jgi:lipid-A-disaccharide synthase
MVLPGSRRSEVKPLLPIFMQTVRQLKETIPGSQVTLSRVAHLEAGWYGPAKGLVDRWITPEELPEALLRSDVALAASGTVTLGTGLLGVPTVVAYQSSLLNEYVIRHLIGYDRPVSLTNLVLGERVFPEFLQAQVQPPLLAQAVLNWLQDPSRWEDTRIKLATLPSMMAAGERDVGGMLAREIRV